MKHVFTFIKWQGNKSRHINKFIKYFPTDFSTYIEPFLGSGAVFLKLKPDKWIINDINKDLINTWETIKKDPKKIITKFKNFEKTFKSLKSEDQVKKCRKITEKLNDMNYDHKRASIYLLMTLCAYMGIIMKNNKFYFQGMNLNITYSNQTSFFTDKYYNNLLYISDYLNDSHFGKIYNRDYKYILSKAKQGDFVFIDPPYIEDHKYNFNYNKDEILDNKFILDLYKECKKLDNKNVKWLMTQANTKEIKKIFKEYTIKSFDVYRAMKKEYVKELIIFNY